MACPFTRSNFIRRTNQLSLKELILMAAVWSRESNMSGTRSEKEFHVWLLSREHYSFQHLFLRFEVWRLRSSKNSQHSHTDTTHQTLEGHPQLTFACGLWLQIKSTLNSSSMSPDLVDKQSNNGEFCFTTVERADIRELKSTVTMNRHKKLSLSYYIWTLFLLFNQ